MLTKTLLRLQTARTKSWASLLQCGSDFGGEEAGGAHCGWGGRAEIVDGASYLGSRSPILTEAKSF